MSKAKTPAQLAAYLLAEAMDVQGVEPGNESLIGARPEEPGMLNVGRHLLAQGEVTKAAKLLRGTIPKCAEQVPGAADGDAQAARTQDQRNRLLHAVAGALAALEQTDFRGPNRRDGNERREGKERRGPANAEQKPIPEHRSGTERRSLKDRRTKEREALWEAVQRGEDALSVLAYKLAPLLAVCEVATKATHTLSEFAGIASHDKQLSERLRSIDPEWKTAIAHSDTAQHIGQCMQLAHDLCGDAANEVRKLVNESAEAMKALREGGEHG